MHKNRNLKTPWLPIIEVTQVGSLGFPEPPNLLVCQYLSESWEYRYGPKWTWESTFHSQ